MAGARRGGRKGRSWTTSVVCQATLVAALASLLGAPPLAAASTRHKHKTKKPATPAASPGAPQPNDEATAPATESDASSGEAASHPESAPDEAEPAFAKPDRAHGELYRGVSRQAGPAGADNDAPATAPTLDPPTQPPAESAAPTTALDVYAPDDELALGRGEAARLAKGRIEVAVWTGIDVGRRQFTYSDPIGNAPRPYLLPAAPLTAFGLEVYPLASTLIPVLCDIGFRGRVSRAFAIDSSTTKAAPLDNSWTRFSGEIRGRVLARREHELGIAAGIDASYFVLGTDADRDVGALVPSARTVSFRLGADGRKRVTKRVSLLAGAAWLATITRGEIYNHFRRPHVAGIDTEVGAALTLTREVELRLNGRYTRYFASFDPQVGDTAVAGGALDQQTQLGIAIRYAH